MRDVVVVGAGPAGSVTALLLARAGMDVAIVEQAAFPRTKVCGEYLNSGAIAALDALGFADALKAAAPIDGIRIFAASASTELRFRSPACSLPRADLDDALLRAAVSAGATLVQAHAEGLQYARDAVHVCVRTGHGDRVDIAARYAVGADGSHSTIARKCGLSASPKRHARFALGAHYGNLPALERFVHMFVDGRSYFAVNPLAGARANVMLIVDEASLRTRRSDIDAFVRETADRLSGGRVCLGNLRAEGKRLAFGPLEHTTRSLTARRVLLAGDAGNFVDPFTGQGVYLALRSAKHAAGALLSVLRRDIDETRAWQAYSSAVLNDVRERRRLGAAVALLMRTPGLASHISAVIRRRPARAYGLIDAVAGIGPAGTALSARSLTGLIFG